MDIGDNNLVICVLNTRGRQINSATIANTEEAIDSFFQVYPKAVVALETGTHSPWISRALMQKGYKVYVGNARKLRMIWKSDAKSDIRDAGMLARIARFDSDLLSPIQHRGERSQIDLTLIKSRDLLVKNRTKMINFVRSTVKSIGQRLPSCSSDYFHRHAKEHLPGVLADSLQPVVETIESLTARIREYDRHIEQISEQRYPETGCLKQVVGVGSLTALAFILTLEDAERFKKSRQVGCFVGLTPKLDQSGETDRQLPVTKAGNVYLRRLLVGSAHYILGPFGPDCNLRRFGMRLADRGGKNAKKRAVVAVARKLAVLLHRLWRTGEVYDPFYKDRLRLIQEAV
jgi:transposase